MIRLEKLEAVPHLQECESVVQRTFNDANPKLVIDILFPNPFL
jgi:hypothetical protein